MGPRIDECAQAQALGIGACQSIQLVGRLQSLTLPVCGAEGYFLC